MFLHTWCLPGVVVEPDRIPSFKRLWDRHMDMERMDMDYVQADIVGLGITFGSDIVGLRVCSCAVLLYVCIYVSNIH